MVAVRKFTLIETMFEIVCQIAKFGTVLPS